ncbi:hypothetical protein ASY01nite_10730 [Acetobacter syzygii]|nr:hypothetical protein Absy_003_152 [Acetobacter syzygii]GBR62118.1 hypothetical protein AA0483_0219 [Acetobacter syzygii NRIC 0483]GEL56007.1 hypothetical protein ASY01nite_10730 [Acetobacter syzygii]
MCSPDLFLLNPSHVGLFHPKFYYICGTIVVGRMPAFNSGMDHGVPRATDPARGPVFYQL